jgi:hypothetical protein
MTTVNVTGPDEGDASSLVTWIQYDPALSVAESGLALADSNWVVPAGTLQVDPDGVPTPMPMTTVGFKVPPGMVSRADVRVKVTVPPLCPTVKGSDWLCGTPFTAAGTVPENVMVLVAGDDGLVVEPELLSQAAVARTITSATRLKCFMKPFLANLRSDRRWRARKLSIRA